jgi:hypothetical protein
MYSTFLGECSSLKKRSYLSQWGFNNNETEVHIPLHRALRVRRGGRGAGRYQYYKLHDGLHHGDELKKDWMEMILTRLEQCICSNKMY